MAKGKRWTENSEIHNMTTNGPFIHGDEFSLIVGMGVRFKPTAKRQKGSKIGTYTVSNGQVVRKEFIYGGEARAERGQGNTY